MNVNMISMTAVLWVYSHDMSIFWNIQCVYAKYTTNYTYSNIVQAFVCMHTYVKLVGMITPFTHWRWHVCGCLFVTFSVICVCIRMATYGGMRGVVLLDSAAVKSRHRHPSSQRCERAPHTHATHHPNYAEWAISIECNAFESVYSLR